MKSDTVLFKSETMATIAHKVIKLLNKFTRMGKNDRYEGKKGTTYIVADAQLECVQCSVGDRLPEDDSPHDASGDVVHPQGVGRAVARVQ